MTQCERIDRLSQHLQPVQWSTHYPPAQMKRIAIRLSRVLGGKTTAWLFSTTPQTISYWRGQAREGMTDRALDRRQRGGTPPGIAHDTL